MQKNKTNLLDKIRKIFQANKRHHHHHHHKKAPVRIEPVEEFSKKFEDIPTIEGNEAKEAEKQQAIENYRLGLEGIMAPYIKDREQNDKKTAEIISKIQDVHFENSKINPNEKGKEIGDD